MGALVPAAWWFSFIYNHNHVYIYMGVSINGDTPIAGWLFKGKIVKSCG
jgi:hypothetical protein